MTGFPRGSLPALACLAACATTGLDATTVTATTPLEQALFDDLGADGRLDRFDLLEAGLIASGVGSQAGLDLAMAQARPLLEAVARAVEPLPPGDTLARARAIFAVLHAELLRRYELRQSRIDEALRSGVYNCVSSALLFNALCRRHGIATAAVDAVTHAYSVLFAGDKRIEVETTDPRGFEPFRDEAAYRAFLRARQLEAGSTRLEGVKVVELERALAMRHRSERQVSDLALVSFVYSNRAAVAAEAGRDAEAVAALAKASRLYPADARHAASRDALLHNLALSHIRAGRWREALALLEFARRQSRDEPPPADLLEMLAECHLQLAWQAAERLDVEETTLRLAAASASAPGDARIAHNRAVVVQHLATRLGGTAAGFPRARALLLAELGAGPERAVLLDTLAALTLKRAQDLGEAGDWSAAERTAEETLRLARAAGLSGEPEGALLASRALARFKLARYSEAASDFGEARAKGYDPEGATTRNQSSALLNLAIDAFNKKNCPLALARAAEAERLGAQGGVLSRIHAGCETPRRQ